MSFWHELKRRNVYKVGAAYALVALSIIAVQSDIASGFGISRSFQRWVIIGLAAGFPLVVLFAWVYELTPSGLRRTSEVPRSESITHVTSRRLNYVLTGLVVGAALALGSVWLYGRDPAMRQVTQVLLPEIEAQIERGNWEEAYVLLGEAETLAPSLTDLDELWPQATRLWIIETDPPGALALRRPYKDGDGAWSELGRTPLEVRLPRSLSRLRFELDGYRPVSRMIGYPGGGVGGVVREEQAAREPLVRLDREDDLPESMVRVSGALALPSGFVPTSFFIGRYEVTNAEFKAFVDAGGYENPAYWLHPIMNGDTEIPWQEAVDELFTDALGYAGPSSWELGDFPEGEDDYPVRGISWHEAAAFAEWAGAELPTIYHWRAAVPRNLTSARTPASNIGVAGSAGRAVAVGQFDAPGKFGAYDVSGNVREWLFNSVRGLRFVAGGAWDDPPWFAEEPDTVSPLSRDARNGLRLARTFDEEPVRSEARADVTPPARVDHFVPQLISDDALDFYDYDPVELEAKEIERIEEKHWTRVQVEFNTAYGERMPLYLYLPRDAEPPFRTIVHTSGAGAWSTPSFDRYPFNLDLLVRAGYAVAMPVYKGSFERIDPLGISFQNWENQRAVERIREIVRDARVSLDYLATREDIDSTAFGYFGFSIGSVFSPIILAVEPRFEVAVLASGGFSYINDRFLNLIDPGRYLDRVEQPVLMINGEFDEIFPLETHIKPFHERLGSQDKRIYVVTGAGHALSREDLFRESIEWLDTRL